MCSPCFYRVIHVETPRKVWENSAKKLWKHSPVALVPKAFLVLPNFHLYFYNLIETRRTCFVFFFFNSEKAVFDGKKAIRGGIPVVFRKYTE